MQTKACGIDWTPLSVFNFYFGWWPARINYQISTMSQTGEMCHEHGSWGDMDQIVWRKDQDDNWPRTPTILTLQELQFSYHQGSLRSFGSATTKEASVQPPPRKPQEFRLSHQKIPILKLQVLRFSYHQGRFRGFGSAPIVKFWSMSFLTNLTQTMLSTMVFFHITQIFAEILTIVSSFLQI